jgi:hypothetical protein
MVLQPLFWLYLACHLAILVFLTNRIGIRQHAHWNEVLWTVLFLVAQALPTLGLMGAWDFTAASWPALPWFWKAWCIAVAGWVLWMALDGLYGRLFVRRPCRVRLVSDRPVRHPFRPPWRWLSRLGVRNQFYDLHAVTWEAYPPGWPAAFDGLALVHLSDFHHNPRVDPRYLEMVREVARTMDPDLLLLTGDFVSHARLIPQVAASLKGWRARLGAYAVLGNHDHWTDAGAVKRGLAAARIRVLGNEWVRIRRKGRTLALIGVDDIWVGERDDAKVEGVRADARILLAHQPDHLYLALRLKASLMLSGHTHGGQIRFPLLGPLVVPADEGRKLAAGFQRRSDTLLFVNRGLGAWPPLRVMCPPEVVKIVLRAGEPSSRK